jgi:hypothetical protein
MNHSFLSLGMITIGIGICGFFGAQLPSTIFKHTSSTMARDWLTDSTLKVETNAVEIKTTLIDPKITRLNRNLDQLKADPGARLTQWTTEQGGLFCIGILLILGGSLWSRQIARDELYAEMETSKDQNGFICR